MKESIVFMFSGQGSQYYNMGKELFNHNSTFRRSMLELDDTFYSKTGKSVIKLLYHDNKQKSEIFDALFYTHPAIFMVEYSLGKVLLEKGIYPDYVLGSSLGEFTAFAFAGVMDSTNILECLITQTKMVEANCEKGGMISIIADYNQYDEIQLLRENSELVSVNYDTHFVVSSSLDNLRKIESYLKIKGIVFYRLPVTYAFHSKLMDPISAIYKDVLKTKHYKTPELKYISSVTGSQITTFKKEYLWDVVREPINFRTALKYLSSEKDHTYIDLGPSGTLENLAKNNLSRGSQSRTFSVITPFGNEVKNIDKLCNKKNSCYKQINERNKKNMKAYVFPGQGSQYKGMGGEIFDEFKDFTKVADNILNYSIKDLCLNDPDNLLGLTDYTQPAIFVTNALSYLKKVKETETKPDFLAGHSVGELNALFAAGAFDFETGVKLAKKRGELMRLATGGGMAAVVGLKIEEILKILKENNLEGIDIANFNTPSQIVISGPEDLIKKAKLVFEENGAIQYMVLNVSGAFHSRYMADAGESFKQYIEQCRFSELAIPVVSNVYARPYKNSNIKMIMVEQITNCVKWTESIRYLMGKGDMEFLQIGPGNVLTGLIRNIQRDSEPLLIAEDDDIEENMEAIKEEKKIAIVEDSVEPISKDVEDAVTQKTEAKEHKDDLVDNEALNKDRCENSNSQESGPKSNVERLPKDNRTEVEIPNIQIQPESIATSVLGSSEFKKEFNLRYAYLTGAMCRGIASKVMIIRMAKSGMMGFLGTEGLELFQVEEAIKSVQKELNNGQPYGMNLVSNPIDSGREEEIVDVFLKYDIKNIETSGFMTISRALVKYRLKGLTRNSEGKVIAKNRIIAKISRPEVAEAFLSPPPLRIVEELIIENIVTREEAELSKYIPMADALTAESDSGGCSDGAVAFALIPTIIRLRNEMINKYNWNRKIWIGTAGGIGTPEAVLAAFSMDVDFIVTGSINQCTVEADTSDAVKDLLQQMNVQDTEYAPASNMFEIGAKVQVLKKSLFFSARANKLYELYKQYNSLDEIDTKTGIQLQEKYFKRDFEEVYSLAKSFFPEHEVERAERNPKSKMAMVFKWYLGYSMKLALSGDPDNKVDYQVYCGPALGAFNQWVKGTPLESWRNRHVDEIGKRIMDEAEVLLKHRYKSLMQI